MLRNASEVAAELAVAFPQDQLQHIDKGRGTFDYIPWDLVVRVLDRIFTPFGWSVEPVTYSSDAAHGVYLAAVKLSVSVLDEQGNVITVSRCGFGRGVAAGQGATVSDNIQVHDTAIAAAGSDALVRATKLLGDAFGLYLYGQKRQPAQAPARRTDTRAIAPNPAAGGQTRTYAAGSGHPTAKQRPYLLKAGYTDEAIDAMSFDEGKAALDAFFQEGRRADGTTDPEFGKRRPAAPAREPEADAIPF